MKSSRRGPSSEHPNDGFAVISTVWGPFGVVLSSRGCVRAAFLPEPEASLRKRIRRAFPEAREIHSASSIRSQIQGYFRGHPTDFDIEIDAPPTPPFRRRVLEACQRIPYGQTRSYADLARAVGSPGAYRAVGSAMANNPIPLLIPCHRVLHADGTLGGFSSPRGLSQKMRMLLLENPSFRIMDPRRSKTRGRTPTMVG